MHATDIAFVLCTVHSLCSVYTFAVCRQCKLVSCVWVMSESKGGGVPSIYYGTSGGALAPRLIQHDPACFLCRETSSRSSSFSSASSSSTLRNSSLKCLFCPRRFHRTCLEQVGEVSGLEAEKGGLQATVKVPNRSLPPFSASFFLCPVCCGYRFVVCRDISSTDSSKTQRLLAVGSLALLPSPSRPVLSAEGRVRCHRCQRWHPREWLRRDGAGGRGVSPYDEEDEDEGVKRKQRKERSPSPSPGPSFPDTVETLELPPQWLCSDCLQLDVCCFCQLSSDSQITERAEADNGRVKKAKRPRRESVGSTSVSSSCQRAASQVQLRMSGRLASGSTSGIKVKKEQDLDHCPILDENATGLRWDSDDVNGDASEGDAGAKKHEWKEMTATGAETAEPKDIPMSRAEAEVGEVTEKPSPSPEPAVPLTTVEPRGADASRAVADTEMPDSPPLSAANEDVSVLDPSPSAAIEEAATGDIRKESSSLLDVSPPESVSQTAVIERAGKDESPDSAVVDCLSIGGGEGTATTEDTSDLVQLTKVRSERVPIGSDGGRPRLVVGSRPSEPGRYFRTKPSGDEEGSKRPLGMYFIPTDSLPLPYPQEERFESGGNSCSVVYSSRNNGLLRCLGCSRKQHARCGDLPAHMGLAAAAADSWVQLQHFAERGRPGVGEVDQPIAPGPDPTCVPLIHSVNKRPIDSNLRVLLFPTFDISAQTSNSQWPDSGEDEEGTVAATPLRDAVPLDSATSWQPPIGALSPESYEFNFLCRRCQQARGLHKIVQARVHSTNLPNPSFLKLFDSKNSSSEKGVDRLTLKWNVVEFLVLFKGMSYASLCWITFEQLKLLSPLRASSWWQHIKEQLRRSPIRDPRAYRYIAPLRREDAGSMMDASEEVDDDGSDSGEMDENGVSSLRLSVKESLEAAASGGGSQTKGTKNVPGEKKRSDVSLVVSPVSLPLQPPYPVIPYPPPPPLLPWCPRPTWRPLSKCGVRSDWTRPSRILDCRFCPLGSGHLSCLVKWSSLPYDLVSWEPAVTIVRLGGAPALRLFTSLQNLQDTLLARPKKQQQSSSDPICVAAPVEEAARESPVKTRGGDGDKEGGSGASEDQWGDRRIKEGTRWIIQTLGSSPSAACTGGSPARKWSHNPNRDPSYLNKYGEGSFVPYRDRPAVLGKEPLLGCGHPLEGSKRERLFLYDYQLEGINWLRQAWRKESSVILADEMGLGKTIQICSFLASLWNDEGVQGPFLIVAPLATVENVWMKELGRWAPFMNVVPYFGDRSSREVCRSYEFFYDAPASRGSAIRLGEREGRGGSGRKKYAERGPAVRREWIESRFARDMQVDFDRETVRPRMPKFPSATSAGRSGQKARRADQSSDEEERSKKRATEPAEPPVGSEVLLKADVVVTSFEVFKRDSRFLTGLSWKCVVVDEGHRMKNWAGETKKILSQLKSPMRVVLTGTPLQNNVKEFFSLLNFLEPQKFTLAMADEFDEKDEDNRASFLRDLKPHFLRRVKKDVLAGLIPPKREQILRVENTAAQKSIYKDTLLKNRAALLQGPKALVRTRRMADEFDGIGLDEGPKRYQRNYQGARNVMMELRKCCCHPYLLLDEGFRYPSDEEEFANFVSCCGKLQLLDRILPLLKEDGHRVLIFSQFVKVLDILEIYLTFKRWGYERLDGRIKPGLREAAIKRFNNLVRSKFVFLLSTRAGGLGINLCTADTVILYDCDWNPHNDLQAQVRRSAELLPRGFSIFLCVVNLQARAHRVGQTRKVGVFRFVTRASVEERIVEIGKTKLVLDQLVANKLKPHEIDSIVG